MTGDLTSAPPRNLVTEMAALRYISSVVKVESVARSPSRPLRRYRRALVLGIFLGALLACQAPLWAPPSPSTPLHALSR